MGCRGMGAPWGPDLPFPWGPAAKRGLIKSPQAAASSRWCHAKWKTLQMGVCKGWFCLPSWSSRLLQVKLLQRTSGQREFRAGEGNMEPTHVGPER